MKNFTYFNPTTIYFGEGQIASITQAIPHNSKVLVLYGGGSILRNGVLDQVREALQEHTFFEFGGIEANPHYETLMQAVELIRREKVDFLLPVGGGSVADGSKLIAAAACYSGTDAWQDLIIERQPINQALPIGCVLTLPATASESNCGAVITHAEKGLKRAFSHKKLFPVFAVLDPTTTYSLPVRQVANGIVDSFIHVIEQYLTTSGQGLLQDRYAEGILQTLIEISADNLTEDADYDARAELMWAANQALNGLIGSGVSEDWSTHIIGHELTAMFGIDHARTLAAVLPHNLRARKNSKYTKLLQYAERVWHIQEGTEDERIEAGILATEEFFASVGMETKLSALGATPETAAILAQRLRDQDLIALGEDGSVTPELVEKMLYASLDVSESSS